MREIRFRGIQAFGTGAGRWLYGALIRFEEPEHYDSEGRDYSTKIQNDNESIYVKPETVGQFIGRDDSSRAPMFEGDVVKCLMSTDHHSLPHIGEIVYMEYFGAFATKNQAGETLLHNHQLNTFEVVGNIHQNPELMK